MITLPFYVVDQILEVKLLVVYTMSSMNLIMGSKWIHVVKGVLSTLHQRMRCQSLNGLYTIDIKGDNF